MLRTSPRFIEHSFLESEYQPLIPGNGAALLDQVQVYASQFPKTAELFGNVLDTHLKKHPLLEDWLIIPHFQFFWDKNEAALKWFEDLFREVHELLGVSQWVNWLEEVIKQTACPTTHMICNRLYDYQLQLSGGLYLARIQWTTVFIPQSNEEKSPDARGMKNGQKCVLESKFIHTSEKYETFCRRFTTAIFKYARPRPSLLFSEQFRFPSSLSIKEISPSSCTLLKAFIRKVCENPEIPQSIMLMKFQLPTMFHCPLPWLQLMDNMNLRKNKQSNS
jgi:hypothetical protein